MENLDIQKAYETAKVFFDEGKLEEAEEIYLKLLERNPNGYADIYNNLGQIYFQKGLMSKAAEYFEKALGLNPRYTEASLNLVVTYNEMKKFPEAERVFNRAAEIVKQNNTAEDPYIQGKLANEHAKLGDMYYGLGRYLEALQEYQKGHRLRPRFPDILTKIGITLREQGALEEAIQYFERAKSVNPNYLTASVHLGLAFYSRGNIKRAIEEWEYVKKIDPSHRGVQAYLSLARKK